MGGHEIVGELFHDHEIYESLWGNLGMSDIKQTMKSLSSEQ